LLPAGNKEPDGSFIPNNRPRVATRIWPTFILEVGFSDRLIDSHNDAQRWLATTQVRVVLIISIWPQRTDGTFQAVAMRYRQPVVAPAAGAAILADQAISFGTARLHHQSVTVLNNLIAPAPPVPAPPTLSGWLAGAALQLPCNAAGLAQYQLLLPTADLFQGVPAGVPAGLLLNINIDLFEVQQKVNNAFQY